MIHNQSQRFCIALLMLLASAVAQATEPSPAALAMIEELGLRESSTPTSRLPGWGPRKIVVSLLPAMGLASQEYEAAMIAAAGDAELVFDRSGGVLPARELLAGADAVIGMCIAPLMQRVDSSLLWMHSYFVGMDYCTQLSPAQLDTVVFSNNKRLSGPAIAEHTIAMLMALSHQLPAVVKAQAKEQWRRGLAAKRTFGELKGKTLLVVGLGGIGTEIAWRAHGLGMRVMATRHSSRSGPDYVDYVGLPDELHRLAGEADVIANALPLTPATTGIFNTAFFAAAKPGAIFLSVGRGKSTDTQALVEALQTGQLFGAGLDVTDPEPLPKKHPLWQMDNVIITPHIAAAGSDSAQRTMVITAENLRRYIAGDALLNVVDMRKGY